LGDQDLRQWVLSNGEWNLLIEIKNLLSVRNINYLIIFLIFYN